MTGEQLPLIPLTEEQLRERSRMLAQMLYQREQMVKRHDEQREIMSEEKRQLDRAIKRTADAVRLQGEPGE